MRHAAPRRGIYEHALFGVRIVEKPYLIAGRHVAYGAFAQFLAVCYIALGIKFRPVVFVTYQPRPFVVRRIRLVFLGLIEIFGDKSRHGVFDAYKHVQRGNARIRTETVLYVELQIYRLVEQFRRRQSAYTHNVVTVAVFGNYCCSVIRKIVYYVSHIQGHIFRITAESIFVAVVI